MSGLISVIIKQIFFFLFFFAFFFPSFFSFLHLFLKNILIANFFHYKWDCVQDWLDCVKICEDEKLICFFDS